MPICNSHVYVHNLVLSFFSCTESTIILIASPVFDFHFLISFQSFIAISSILFLCLCLYIIIPMFMHHKSNFTFLYFIYISYSIFIPFCLYIIFMSSIFCSCLPPMIISILPFICVQSPFHSILFLSFHSHFKLVFIFHPNFDHFMILIFL
jgi:hypothetical protein